MKNFIRVDENFVCANCGHETVGDGYTNHCPKCLWSRHVDQTVPGDRKSTCLGLMEPVGADQKSGQWKVIHKCTKCGKVTQNKVAKNDNLDLLAILAVR